MNQKIILIIVITFFASRYANAQSNGDYYKRYLLNREYVDSALKDYNNHRYQKSAAEYIKARLLCPYYRLDGCEYYTARCFAKLNKIDSAVYFLKKCTHSDLVVKKLLSDTALNDLRNDSLIFKTLTMYFSNIYNDTGTNALLKNQLTGMKEGDQKLRYRIDQIDTTKNIDSATYQTTLHALWDIQQKIDDSDLEVLKSIVKIYGWPTYSLVGKEASYDAWLILQHCNGRDSFQKTCLPLIEVAVRNKQASEQNLAYLKDRILMRKGRKQIYGTQFEIINHKASLWPVENEEELDVRREKTGLEPIGIQEKTSYNLDYTYAR